jgi:hypothetical protein
MPRPAAPPVPPGRVVSNPASAAGPKKETARIAVLPDPPARPPSAVEMKKTQPLITAPESVAPVAPVMVNVPPTAIVQTFVTDIPMSFCWALLLASTAILIIQIWNYVS